MASFNTQDGNNRMYSAESYNTAQAAGGQRSSPAASKPVVGAGLQAMRPGGYVPTYAKYAQPNAAMVASAAPGASRSAAAPTMPTYQSGVTANSETGLMGGMYDKYSDALSKSVKGYGDMAGQDFQQQVGTLLGNLNGIGALRSGGVQAGINDAMTHYGREVGDYAQMTANNAANLAQGQYTYDQQEADKQQQYADAKKAAHKSAIGKIIGGVGGAVSAIPGVGTVAGGIINGIGSIFG